MVAGICSIRFSMIDSSSLLHKSEEGCPTPVLENPGEPRSLRAIRYSRSYNGTVCISEVISLSY